MAAGLAQLAVAIMGGLVVATVLTLLFLPALYAAWFSVPRPSESADVEREADATPPVSSSAVRAVRGGDLEGLRPAE